MLRHHEHETTARTHSPRGLREREFILVNVLQNVQHEHRVEAGDNLQVARIHLKQRHPSEPSPRHAQARLRKFPAHGPQLRPGTADRSEHETRTAADLENVTGCRKVRAKHPGDQPIARSEPEAARLEHLQAFEERIVIRPVRPRTATEQRNERGTRLRVAISTEPRRRGGRSTSDTPHRACVVFCRFNRCVSVDHLSWDTDFFGLKISRVAADPRSLEAAFEQAARDSVECLYVYVRASEVATVMQAVLAGAILVDLRSELEGAVRATVDTASARRATTSDLPRVNDLAEKLAETSRFRVDRRFAPDRVAEMYRIWVRRCFDEGVVVVSNDGLDGFVGAALEGEETQLSLVYVARHARGRGLAKELVGAALRELGANRARVVTQAGNVAALRVYESLGLRTSSAHAVLHLWPRDLRPRPRGADRS